MIARRVVLPLQCGSPITSEQFQKMSISKMSPMQNQTRVNLKAERFEDLPLDLIINIFGMLKKYNQNFQVVWFYIVGCLYSFL